MSSKAILVVEDHPMMRAMVGDVLRTVGYEPLLADGAGAALQMLNRDIGALVTDIRLGEGPDGWAVARHFRQARPTLPVLYMSADAMDEWTSEGVPESQLIEKAFGCNELLAALDAVLGSPKLELHQAA